MMCALAGCSEYDNPYPLHGSSPGKTLINHPLEIVSEPSGARIEVNDEYVADAPCVIKVPVDENGGSNAPLLMIRAIPSQPGEYVQTKTFLRYDRVPNRILFSMYLGRPTPEVNVNVNKQ